MNDYDEAYDTALDDISDECEMVFIQLLCLSMQLNCSRIKIAIQPYYNRLKVGERGLDQEKIATRQWKYVKTYVDHSL